MDLIHDTPTGTAVMARYFCLTAAHLSIALSPSATAAAQDLINRSA